MEKCQNVKTLMESGSDFSDISKALSKLTVEEVENYRIGISGRIYYHQFQYDLMHMAVNANRKDVVECMFGKGCFLLSSLPDKSCITSWYETRHKEISYSHIACIFGYMDIVDLIIQNRPHEKDMTLSAEVCNSLDKLIAPIRGGNFQYCDIYHLSLFHFNCFVRCLCIENNV